MTPITRDYTKGLPNPYKPAAMSRSSTGDFDLVSDQKHVSFSDHRKTYIILAFFMAFMLMLCASRIYFEVKKSYGYEKIPDEEGGMRECTPLLSAKDRKSREGYVATGGKDLVEEVEDRREGGEEDT